jgi:hypothetical protein
MEIREVRGMYQQTGWRCNTLTPSVSSVSACCIPQRASPPHRLIGLGVKPSSSDDSRNRSVDNEYEASVGIWAVEEE